MSDFLKDIIKETGNEYATLVSEGVEAGDVDSFIDTGSHALNALLSGSIYGGMPSNKITAIAGEAATGKTFFALGIVKAFLEKLNKFIRTKEPNAYDYSYFISEDGKRITLIEKFRTSEDFIYHVDNFENGPNIATFMKMFTFKSFVIAGNTSEGLRERIKAYPVDYRGNIGGWIY